MLSSLYGKYENCTLLIKSVGRCTGWAGYIHMYKSNVVFSNINSYMVARDVLNILW
jgi:hypothetical protein